MSRGTLRPVRFVEPLTLAALVLASSWGCTAKLSGEKTDGATTAGGASGLAGSSGTGNPAAGTGAGAGVDITDVLGVDPNTLPDGVPASSRALRLGYSEYDRTLSDLLQLPVGESRNFPEEQPNLGPYEGKGERAVNERLLNELTRSAESLATQVVTTPASYAAVVGCEPASSGCRDQFITSFGLRALRQPLSATEKTRYTQLFDRGAELINSGDAFRDGVQLVVEALLQSPKFLYRLEVGEGADDAGKKLTGYEVARRLSYMLLGTMPDPQLFEAAASGALLTAEGLTAQAERLANDARFGERVLEFHDRWMQLGELNALTKDQQVFPLFSPELVSSMRAETRRFVTDVTLEQGGTISALLTAPYGYADAPLAGLYGLSGSFGSELTRVTHDASSGRKGLFTQASFLAGHSSSSSGTSPILRAVFLLRRVACATIPDPPAGAQMEKPAEEPAEPIVTTRQYFSWKTSMTRCAGCHSLINPTGFAFEHFDGLGQRRETEKGAPIDASGSLSLGQDQLTFTDAAGLLEGLASSAQVKACYGKNWLQFAYGRAETQADLRALGLAARDLATPAFTIRDLAVSLTQRPAFTHLPGILE
jgi:hypothetical protein